MLFQSESSTPIRATHNPGSRKDYTSCGDNPSRRINDGFVPPPARRSRRAKITGTTSVWRTSYSSAEPGSGNAPFTTLVQYEFCPAVPPHICTTSQLIQDTHMYQKLLKNEAWERYKFLLRNQPRKKKLHSPVLCSMNRIVPKHMKPDIPQTPPSHANREKVKEIRNHIPHWIQMSAAVIVKRLNKPPTNTCVAPACRQLFLPSKIPLVKLYISCPASCRRARQINHNHPASGSCFYITVQSPSCCFSIRLLEMRSRARGPPPVFTLFRSSSLSRALGKSCAAKQCQLLCIVLLVCSRTYQLLSNTNVSRPPNSQEFRSRPL